MAAEARDAGTAGHDECIELFSSLGRVVASVASGLDLPAVLQSIVDSICDHTDWQLCWISAVDAASNSLEVVARRDKLDYSQRGQRVWPLDELPALDAVRSGQPIYIEDARSYTRSERYAADARRRGYVCGAVLPLEVADAAARPMVLSVHSKRHLLPDPMQQAFLNASARIASLAVQNAALVDRATQELFDTREAIGSHSSVIERVIQGTGTNELFNAIEVANSASLVVIDTDGEALYIGSPPQNAKSHGHWHSAAMHCVDAAMKECDSTGQQQSTCAAALGDETTIFHTWMEIIESPGAPLARALFVRTRPWSVAETSLIRSVARASVAVVMLRGWVQYQTELELGSTVLDNLLLSSSSSDASEMVRRGSHIGLNLSEEMWLAVVEPAMQPSASELEEIARSLRPYSGALEGALISRTSRGLVAFIPARHGAERIDGWLRELHAAVSRRLDDPVIIALEGPVSEPSAYRDAWTECRRIISLARKLGRDGIVRLRDFGASRFLLAASHEADVERFIEDSIGALISYDDAHGGDLVTTLESFIENGGRFQATAERLNVHVSTLRYRMQRIEEIGIIEPRSATGNLDLALALRLYRLRSD